MAFCLPLCPSSYDDHIIWFLYRSRRTVADLDHFVGTDEMFLDILSTGSDTANYQWEACFIALIIKSQ